MDSTDVERFSAGDGVEGVDEVDGIVFWSAGAALVCVMASRESSDGASHHRAMVSRDVGVRLELLLDVVPGLEPGIGGWAGVGRPEIMGGREPKRWRTRRA